jgi:hypothetical protein
MRYLKSFNAVLQSWMLGWLGPKWRQIGFHGDENVDCGTHNPHGGYTDYQTTEDRNRIDSLYLKKVVQRSPDLQFFAYAMIRSRNLAVSSLGLAARTKPHSQPLHTIIRLQKKYRNLPRGMVCGFLFNLWHNTVLEKSCSHMNQDAQTEKSASCCTKISVCVSQC